MHINNKLVFIYYNLITLYFVSMNETLQRLAEFKNSAKAEAMGIRACKLSSPDFLDKRGIDTSSVQALSYGQQYL